MSCHKKQILQQISQCLYPNKGIKFFWLSHLEPLHGNGWVCAADHALHLAIYLVELCPVQFQQHQRESRYRCRCRLSETFKSSFYGDARQLRISCSWTLSILATQDTQYLYCLGKQKQAQILDPDVNLANSLFTMGQRNISDPNTCTLWDV